jgi:pSer/pThr/pTyr-binding forkhead associated (FHA) protein
MNRKRVTLRVPVDFDKVREYVFESPTRCMIGRGIDCQIRLTSGVLHAGVSRHHCLLVVEPATAHLRDLGSLNGTYVNGRPIGQRGCGQGPQDVDAGHFSDWELKDGDEVQVGGTIIRVRVADLELDSCPTIPFSDSGRDN